ncbi:protein phosphatase 2C domain-containing protein [Rhodopirellula sp. JC740]|uniref:Protein phosphatase 2C domain-containing protein n=1 Tax=Rhodopirellula halodulae TaxID=2894198 RepID=A0ABS8NKY2_9BACT|nr:protein phosphatase 2C domain-containing protein [Rhodopirellula sp. JC740]
MKFAEQTHVGMRRANNQDSSAVLLAESEERLNQRGHLFVVADGMGAHAAGELASQIASERITAHYYKSREDVPEHAIAEAVHLANAAIYARGQSNPEFLNMGTTASSLVLVGGAAFVAHVGDSRVYRLRQGVLEQLTFDHSLVWEMQASGKVHSDSIFSKSIPKNVITRSLGPSPEVLVDLEGPFDIEVGDRFLVCSDGLTGQIEDDELAVLLQSLDVEKASRVMIDLANLRGGPDNITLIIVEVTDESITENHGPPRKARSIGADEVSSRALIGTTAFCWTGAVGFGIASALVSPRFVGSAIVAFILGSISAAVWASGIFKPNDRRRPLKTRRSVNRSGLSGDSSGTTGTMETGQGGSASGGEPLDMGSGETAIGNGPYRRYKADSHQAFVTRLDDVITQLKQTSEERNWMLDWQEVDRLLQRAREAAKDAVWGSAVSLYCDATLGAMQQLKKHQDDSASDTVVDL